MTYNRAPFLDALSASALTTYLLVRLFDLKTWPIVAPFHRLQPLYYAALIIALLPTLLGALLISPLGVILAAALFAARRRAPYLFAATLAASAYFIPYFAVPIAILEAAFYGKFVSGIKAAGEAMSTLSWPFRLIFAGSFAAIAYLSHVMNFTASLNEASITFVWPSSPQEIYARSLAFSAYVAVTALYYLVATSLDAYVDAKVRYLWLFHKRYVSPKPLITAALFLLTSAPLAFANGYDPLGSIQETILIAALLWITKPDLSKGLGIFVMIAISYVLAPLASSSIISALALALALPALPRAAEYVKARLGL